ncbi:MAG: DUF2779 domain-containing protein [Dehalococcoidia bacterium]|nr:DUF2779 domain-containing protein [Dehalococcoidia bacterium]
MSTRFSRLSFLNAVACPRLGWFSRLATPPVELSPGQGTLAERFLSEEQRNVHDRVRALFPDAVMVTRQAYEAACWQTQDLLDLASTTAVLEAAFGTTTCRARADILAREGDSWHLYEVKAQTHLTREAVDQMAFIWMVLDEAGVQLSRASLVLVSRDYRAGSPDRELFHLEDVTGPTAARAGEFTRILPALNMETRSTEPPTPHLIPHCRHCPLFRSCFGADLKHPVFELPHVTPPQLGSMFELGYRAITDVPDRTLLKERQAAVWESVRNGKMVLTSDLNAELNAISWPTHYLDFETVGTALPLLPDYAPFEQMPFLYSVRVCDKPGSLQAHRAFLAPHDRVGSRELVERLLQDLGNEGSIAIYSQYQARVIRGLARRHPDLSEALSRVRGRMVDLEHIIRHCVYHPDFHGSTSLRAVIAALVPGLSYIDLEIEDAQTASAAFAFLMRGDYYSATRAPLVRRDLYSYCARDTFALVRLHQALLTVSSP